jgi:hypothetical protein
VIAVSHLKDFPSSVEIPVNDTAACIYLLHTSTKPTSENVAGNITLVYSDGSKKNNYMIMGKHLTYWWFSQLKTDYSGIAWYGKNDISEGVGLSWSAIDNPFPGKQISKIILEPPADNGIYTVFSISLADKPHYVPVNPVSFGGPDNWAGATAMAALVEGLAGIKDAPKTEAFSSPVISPKWINTNANDVNVTIRYEASNGYVSYHYKNRPEKNQIELLTTGSGKNMVYHIELPANIKSAKSVISENNKGVPFKTSTIENTSYTDFILQGNRPTKIIIAY